MLSVVAKRVQQPTKKRKLVLYTDGNDDYTYVLPTLFDTRYVRYGQLVKVREKGRVVDKIKHGIYGKPRHKKIETTNVENYNGILREHCGRLVRRTKCFAKKVKQLDASLTLVGFYRNFMKPMRVGMTPAMIEGLVNHAWSWEEFFYGKLSFV